MPDTYPIDKVRSHLLSKSSAEYDATLVHPGTITGTVFSKDSLMALNLTQHDIDLLTMQDGDSIRDSAAESRQIPRTTVTPSKNRASASKFSILGSLEFLSNGKTASKREITESRSMPDDKEARNGDEVVDLAPPTMFLRSHVKQRRRSMFPEIFEKEKSLDMHQLDRKSVCAPTPSKGRRSSFANEFGRDGKPALTRDTSKSSLKNSSQQLNGLKRRLSAVGLLPWNGMIEVTMKDETKQIQAKNLATAADIRAEICNAFEIPPSEAAEYQIYVNASEIITKKCTGL